ncbi:MAG: cation:proton antiporter, partial [Chloroflexota bacterium]|nr:cation:proton antiporter [Chloroflexota bacterium]
LWEALDYAANALLFLLIGLVIGPRLLVDELGAILLAAAVVLAARAVAVLPIVWLLERVGHIPRVGRRNEAVLIWGGLRGAVALALALALPEELAEREFLVTLTGGVVLITLLLNATTIRWLVSRLGLDRPSIADRYVVAVAQVFARRAASRAMDDLGLAPDDATAAELDAAERAAREELKTLHVDDDEEYRIVVGRALHVERETYQALSDAGLLPPAVTRTLLHEVDDQLEEFALHGHEYQPRATRRHQRPTLEQLSRKLVGWLPEPAGADPTEMAYGEATARLLAARRAQDAVSALDDLPGISSDTIEHVRRTSAQWQQEALDSLEELDTRAGQEQRELRARQARTLAKAAAMREVTALVESGLLPATVLADAS